MTPARAQIGRVTDRPVISRVTSYAGFAGRTRSAEADMCLMKGHGDTSSTAADGAHADEPGHAGELSVGGQRVLSARARERPPEPALGYPAFWPFGGSGA